MLSSLKCILCIYTTSGPVYSLKYAPCIIQCALCTIQCALCKYTASGPVYSLKCALCIIKCALCTIKCALYSLKSVPCVQSSVPYSLKSVPCVYWYNSKLRGSPVCTATLPTTGSTTVCSDPKGPVLEKAPVLKFSKLMATMLTLGGLWDRLLKLRCLSRRVPQHYKPAPGRDSTHTLATGGKYVQAIELKTKVHY